MGYSFKKILIVQISRYDGLYADWKAPVHHRAHGIGYLGYLLLLLENVFDYYIVVAGSPCLMAYGVCFAEGGN